MTRKQRTARIHTIAYQMLQQAIDSGFVGSDDAGESDADKVAIEKGLDRWAQFHFNRSDLAATDE